MRRISCVLLILALPLSEFSVAQGHAFYFSPIISFDSFHSLGFDSGLDYGIGAGVRLNPTLTFSVAALFGERTPTFDLIGATGTLDTKVSSYEGSLEVLALGQAGRAELSVIVGGGLLSSSVGPHSVSLGALGSLTVPGSSSSQGFFQAGLAAGLPLGRAVEIVIIPSLRRLTPVSSSSNDVAIAGGLRVGIL
ncbi:MAG TPA: hypothetical protein VEO56_14475 [Bacteroidota bacterium]|nr:hypothetical protein [Bacteroidota bacterium]